MDPDTITRFTGGATQTSGSAASLSQLSEDYTRFLTLLTAQISNQDPLDPMDSTQFVSQLAQLSQVEQAVKVNQQIEALGTKINALSAIAGTAMIGAEVAFVSDKVVLEAGRNDTYYSLPEGGAHSVVAEIRDQSDRLVRKITGLPGQAVGHSPITWDGRDEDGVTVPDGVYKVTVEATDAAGEELDVLVFRRAVVSEVLFESGEIFYDVGAGEIASSEAILAAK